MAQDSQIASQRRWDERFLKLCYEISTWSKDPSTQTGAVLTRPDRTIASVGYNGFAKGMKDDPELYANREIKYSRVIHCEVNAVMHAREQVEGYTLYTTGPSCDRCAVHMIHAGIRRFVFIEQSPEQAIRWNVQRTFDYFKEVDAEVVMYKRDAFEWLKNYGIK